MIFGTRPEIIKLYPVMKALKKNFKVVSVFTGQQRDLGRQMLKEFRIKPDYDLNVMTEGQSLSLLTARLHEEIALVLSKENPNLVIVQGDTATALVGAIEGYFHKIPVAHVEAGLRTDDVYNPFPEEMNRRIISQIATYNFTPTDTASERLRRDNLSGYLLQVGQTGIDTLLQVAKNIKAATKRQVLVTIHRRESFGAPLKRILLGIRDFLDETPGFNVLLPVHPNPNVKDTVKEILGKHPQVKLVDPLPYRQMIKEMKKSYFIMTDSGGIQEEAPALRKPVMVLRETTERPEGVDAKVALLVGTDTFDIAEIAHELATDTYLYESLQGDNPYGDGKASERIAEYLQHNL